MNDVAELITTRIDRPVRSLTEVDGGMIGEVYRVDLEDDDTVVAKVGDTPLGTEARMLRYLDEHGLRVPSVLSASDDLLVMEHVAGSSTITPSVERDAADRLARLHANVADAFGFPFETLTGPVRQPNPWTEGWTTFLADHRFRHVIQRCRERDRLDATLRRRLDRVIDRLDDLLVAPDRPALIHGDVWETNLLTDGERVLAFLDPACYYAHPEVELAYADWTGTFGEPFFERYRNRRGIEPGFFERRRFVYRLYPLLVHLLLFDEPYGDRLAETLDRIG